MNLELSLLLKALDAASVGALITDRRGTVEWVSSAFARITGYSPEEAIGRNVRFLKSSSHPPSFFSGLWQTIQSGRVWRGTLVNRHNDGRLYRTGQTIASVRDDRGEIAQFISIFQEVPADDSFEGSEDRYHALIENLGDGVLSA